MAGKWLRVSTKQRNLKDAARRACELYDEARFRERLGLTAVARSLGDAARATLTELRAELASGTGKRIYVDYCSAIERLFLPFFGKRRFEQIDHRVVAQFEQWRNERIGRAPAHSTLLTYAAVWQRIQQTALDRGWLTAATTVPKLSVKGRKSQPRPAFSTAEIPQLRESMAVWSAEQTRRSITGELRLMLRDYVELLLLTGMRHGTEAMRVEWQHCEWHRNAGGRQYLRLRVSGKTGPRWLIAKHEAVEVLERLRARDSACAGMTLDTVIAARLPLRLFR